MGSPELEALERLEALVRAAGETIESLRNENAELAEKVTSLEGQAEDASAWAEEREQLAERVSGLADGLGKLIELTDD